MRKSTLIALATTALSTFGLAGMASAQSIHTGSSSGSYFSKVCPAITNVIGAQPSQDVISAGVLPQGPLFFEHTCQTSDGTLDNETKVRANSADLGIGQMNLMAARAEGLFVIPTGVSECLFVVTQDDDMVTATNLSPRVPFGLPGEKTGSTATFRSMEPFSSMRNITYHNSAKAAVEAVAEGKVQAAGFVQIPDTTNAVFEAASDLNFVGVINRGMLRERVNGVAVWEGTPGVQVRTGSIWGAIGTSSNTGQSITTACTPVVVFGAHPDTLEGTAQLDQQDLMDALQRAANAGLLVPDTGDWRTMFASLAEQRKNALDSAMDALEEAGAALGN